MGKVISLKEVCSYKADLFKGRPERPSERERAEKLLQQAHWAFKEENYSTAIQLYEESILIFSEFSSAPKSAYERLSDCYFYASRNSESVDVLEDCIEIYPDEEGLLAKLGMRYLDDCGDTFNPLKAVQCLKKVKARAPKYKSELGSIDLMLAYASHNAKSLGK